MCTHAHTCTHTHTHTSTVVTVLHRCPENIHVQRPLSPRSCCQEKQAEMAVTGDLSPSCALHTQWSIEFGPLQVPRQVLDNQGGHLESLLNASKRTQKETLKLFLPERLHHRGTCWGSHASQATDSHGHWQPRPLTSHYTFPLVRALGAAFWALLIIFPGANQSVDSEAVAAIVFRLKEEVISVCIDWFLWKDKSSCFI